MKDDQLIADVEAAQKDHPDNGVMSLRENGITTYTRLFAVLRDSNTSDHLRTELCYIVSSLYKNIDKRRATWPLIACLRSSSPNVRAAASWAAMQLHIKHAIPYLTKLALDKSQPQEVRIYAILGLEGMYDFRATAILWDIVHDETDDLYFRAEALERTVNTMDEQSITQYIRYLSDNTADLRFWSAFCLSQAGNHPVDISRALTALDTVVAFDHRVPTFYGYHIDREAIQAYEQIYQDMLHLDQNEAYLISPSPEYFTFSRHYRHRTSDAGFVNDPVEIVTLHIEPQWLRDQLTANWPQSKINIRHPRPQAYLLDFLLNIDDHTLIGGLHRDGYALVVTGHNNSVQQFAKWYRGLFPPEQKLYLYEWAGEGVLL